MSYSLYFKNQEKEPKKPKKPQGDLTKKSDDNQKERSNG